MSVREANTADAAEMVALSEEKRIIYQSYSPKFWCKSSDSVDVQLQYFKELIDRDDYVVLISTVGERINGFIIGHITTAPEVYDPGGRACIIDDFAIYDDHDNKNWETVGKALKQSLESYLKMKGVVLTVTVCGHKDEMKRGFLLSHGEQLTSEWYVKEL